MRHLCRASHFWQNCVRIRGGDVRRASAAAPSALAGLLALIASPATPAQVASGFLQASVKQRSYSPPLLGKTSPARCTCTWSMFCRWDWLDGIGLPLRKGLTCCSKGAKTEKPDNSQGELSAQASIMSALGDMNSSCGAMAFSCTAGMLKHPQQAPQGSMPIMLVVCVSSRTAKKKVM